MKKSLKNKNILDTFVLFELAIELKGYEVLPLFISGIKDCEGGFKNVVEVV